jgi:ABC-type transporter Mla MlaB component
MLRIDIESSSTSKTLRCAGRLVYGIETEMLRGMAHSRQEENLRIDLSGVERIDASGLGLLVELQVWARETRRNLTLIDLSAQVWRYVILTKLYLTLEISYSDVVPVSHVPDAHGRREMIA